jgi:NHL repeat
MKRSAGIRPNLEGRGNGKVVHLFSLLCLLLVVVAVGAGVAVADDPEGQPPSPPTAVEMEEGLNADNSAIYEDELTDFQVAEELPHQDLDRAQALDLLVGVFEPLLQAPAGIFDELDVERFLSANAAIIAAGDQPESNGITIGAPPQDRYEGTTLLESTIPLRDEGDAGKTEVVDLGLEPEGDGTIAPSNPLVEVSLPQQLGDGIELPEAGITVELEGAPGALSPSTLDQGVAAYPEVAEDTTLAVAPAPGGFETFTLLQSPDAPTTQTFTLDLPAGASLQATRDGGAEVVRNGEPIMGVSPPTAVDAAGEDVPASMTVSGNALTLDVSPQASTEFPVLLDPLYETYNWWNGITGLGGWASHTNFTPNYYTADKATCTTYASPYACQAGVTSNAPGLYIGELPGAAPVNSSAGWTFKVPRWQEEWTNKGRWPDSFISYMTLEHVGFWHRTDSNSDPTLWMGIWNNETPGWVSGWARGGNSPDWTDQKQLFNAGENTSGKEAAFNLSNPSGHDLTAFRDAFVSTAIVTIGDNKLPSGAPAPDPLNWVDQVPSEPITAKFSDFGLGIYRMKAYPDGVPQPVSTSTRWPLQTAGCTGTTVYPCPGTKTFTLTSHGSGAGEIRDYDPSTMPQGRNYVNLYAEDPVGNKSQVVSALVKVDHSAPNLALSGSATEQATLGTNASQYTLKYSATDGDNAAPEALAPFGSAGTMPGKMQEPRGIATDASGNLWIVDRANDRVMKFDSAGNFLTAFGSPGSGNGQFSDPRSIAISPGGTIWVSDMGHDSVQAFNASGQFIRKITTDPGLFVDPYGLATGPGGTLWVSDISSDRLFKFNESGTLLTSTSGSAGSIPAGGLEFKSATGLATDASGNVWMADYVMNRVVKFNSNGAYVTHFGSTGSGIGQLEAPLGIAIAPSGHLLVTEEKNNRVSVFQPNGVYLRKFGSPVGTDGVQNGDLSAPKGIALGAGNKAFVVDPGNYRVLRWAHADLDRQSGVASTEVKVDGNLVEPKYAPGCATENCSITKEWTLKAKDLSSSLHNVQVTATDGVGLPTTKSLVILTVKDTTAPQLTANSEFFTAPEGWLEQKSYAYTASASDTGGHGVSSLTLKIDGNVVKTTTQSCPNGGCGASISASINMATYKGGAHPAEVIATDLGGNTTTKKWTINVNPKGEIPASEATDTLEAVEASSESSIIQPDPESIDPGMGGMPAPTLVQTESSIHTEGAAAETTLTTDPEDGFVIDTPEGPVEVEPTTVGPEATDTDTAPETAAVVGNAASNSDSVLRPIYDGAVTFRSIRNSAGPTSYSWRVNLTGEQSLVSIDPKMAQVVHGDGRTAAFIEVELAHDATGKEVPTTLTVEAPDVITLTVDHKSQTFIYPVVAGAGFQVGYETAESFDPVPENAFDIEAGGGRTLVVGPPEPVPGNEADASTSSIGEKRKMFAESICGHNTKDAKTIVEALAIGKLPCGNAFTDDLGQMVLWHTTMRGAFLYAQGVRVRHRGAIACGERMVSVSILKDWWLKDDYECRYGPKTADGNGGASALPGHYLRAQAHWELGNRGNCGDLCPPNPWIWDDKALELHLWPNGNVETVVP